jgi:O-antigen/teichoic acid export membrane protein
VSAASLRIGTALALDTSVGAVQGVGLLWLVSQGALTATSALLVTGAAHAAGGLIWLVVWRMRGRICLNPGMLRPAWREHWALGRWVGASRMVGHLSSDVLLLWLLTLGLGASSAGAFAACLTIAFVTNPVVLGVGLFLTPRLAATFADRGVRAVAREAVGTTVALALLLAGFVALVAAGGERLLFAIYGPEFSGLGGTATVVALAVALGALAIGATNALVVLERPGLNLGAGLLGFATMLVSTVVLVPSHGVLGAALGFCAGNVVQLMARFVMLARVVAAASDPRPAPLEVGAARA